MIAINEKIIKKIVGII